MNGMDVEGMEGRLAGLVVYVSMYRESRIVFK